MLRTLEHLRSLDLKIPDENLVWDDANTEAVESDIDQELLETLRQLPVARQAAITFELAEWIIFRFETLVNCTLPTLWLEAAWVGLGDINNIHRTWEEVRDEKEWKGKLRGPIDLAMRHVEWALQDTVDPKESDTAHNTAQLASLVKHVFTDKLIFQQWLTDSINSDSFFSGVDQNPSPNNIFLN